jgi:tetratricopeptide (TPR) repeat protein
VLHEQAIRLSPRDPGIASWYDRLGRIHLLQSRTNEAIGWLERARGANPAHPNIRMDLAAAYALEGDIHRAAAELAEARRLSRDARYSSITRLKAAGISSGGTGASQRSAPYSKRSISSACERSECRRSEDVSPRCDHGGQVSGEEPNRAALIPLAWGTFSPHFGGVSGEFPRRGNLAQLPRFARAQPPEDPLPCYRGDSRLVLEDIELLSRPRVAGQEPFHNRLRCSACHVNGGLVQKETRLTAQ